MGKGIRLTILLVICVAIIQTHMAQFPVAVSVPGINRHLHQKPDSNYLYWKEKGESYRESNNLLGEAGCLQQMGQLLYQLGNYSEAVEKLLAADKIYGSLNNKELLAKNLNLLGTVYYYNQQAPKALELFREALDVFRRLKIIPGLLIPMAPLATCTKKICCMIVPIIFNEAHLSMHCLETMVTARQKYMRI